MKHLRWAFAATSLLFGVAIAIFFALVYPHHLHFQEQYQLFLFNKGYILEVLSMPGGIADLAGRFMTQFFLYAWIGGTIIAMVLVVIQLLTYRFLHSSRCEILSYVLSFIPAILCCCFLCDENALMTVLMALILILVIAIMVQSISTRKLRHAVAFVSVPIAYVMAGGFVIPLAIMLVISEIRRGCSSRDYWICCVILLISLCLPLIWHRWVHCTLSLLYTGPHYYRNPEQFPILAWMAVGFLPLLMVLPNRVKKWSPCCALPVFLSLWGSVMLIGGLMVNRFQSQQQEAVMSYDFMARNALWNRIIQSAQQNPPKNQVSAVALNLALAERGMLASHVFEFPQKGITGLVPNFSSDYISPLVTSEVFYRLGMINSAQRFVFEAQEAIPDFQKSARCYKRLAETNLINGAYEVSRKYLIALQHTLFYSSWAKETLALIEDEEAVNAHPEYGYLRKMRNNQNYLFGGNQLSQILVKLMESNPQNRIAFEYLEASCMLAKDLEKVAQYYSLSEPFQYEKIPSAIQQALILLWSQTHKVSEPIPDYIDKNILQGFNNFYSTLQMHNGNSEPVKKLYGNTYWFYYYFN